MRFEATATTYKGVRMRSLLESRWAATLDHLGIAWEYERAPVKLASGQMYLPDFWLPGSRTVIEVKGMGVGRTAKPAELAREHPDIIVILAFEPATRYTADYLWEPFLQWTDAAGYDARLAQCPACSAWQWIRPQLSRRCRICQHSHEGFLVTSGEMRLTEPAPGRPAFLDAFRNAR